MGIQILHASYDRNVGVIYSTEKFIILELQLRPDPGLNSPPLDATPGSELYQLANNSTI